MTIEIRQLEWLNHNEQRRYPLTIESDGMDQTETFRIPEDFLVGMKLSLPIGLTVDPSKFFLQTLGNFSSGFGLTIGYSGIDGVIPVATANIARVAFGEGQYYRLTGIGDFVEATGHVTLGRLAGIDEQPGGQFTFDIERARLETDVIQPFIRSLSSLRVQNGADLSAPLYGNIVLVAGSNMRLSLIQAAGEDPQIVFDAIEGEGLNEACICADDPDQAPAIRTINGVHATPDGDITLQAGTCFEITPIEHGLLFNDICSKPCCGCQELETITSQLEQFGQNATTLENFVNELNARVTQMDQVVLGSRLSDRGCITCD